MSDAKPAPRRGKKTTNWAEIVQKPASAPIEEIEQEEKAAPRTVAPQHGENVIVTPSGLVRPKTKAATYRLPMDVHEIINNAVAEAAEDGIRRSKDAIVTEMAREWEKARLRRKK